MLFVLNSKAGAKVLHFFDIRKYFVKKSAIIVIFLLLVLGLSAQTHTRVFQENIRTLRVAREVLLLDDINPLQISFDEMSHEVHFYSYTVRMLNSDLLSGEYLTGFPTAEINDYEHSMNTSREYTHYWFEFPNADMTLTKSGDYRLTIYEDNDPDNKVAEIDFKVVESLVKIAANVRSNTDIEFNGRYQQVDIDLNTTHLDIKDPSEIRVVVTQNNRLDNAVTLDKPKFIGRNNLQYKQMRELIFEGGNEFHHFDAYSRFYAGTGIDRVYYEMGDYNVLLFADEIAQGGYSHRFDEDGSYMINAEHTHADDTEAEYMWVHWMLPVDKPFFDGMIYVGGELFHNEMSLRNRMQYDNEHRCYWLTALVKQGAYDYQYWFVPKGQNKTTTQRVDGSFWETENEYAIYIYWRPFGARYDRLVGTQLIRSNR